MGAAAEIKIEVETSDDVWTDLTDDTVAAEGLQIRYGINGDKPLDAVAGSGEATFTVSGRKYSFNHADVLSGWQFGAGIRITMYRTSDAAQAISSITRSSSTATVTTSGSHGYATGDWITIAGAGESQYNGIFQITNTAATTFTYAVPGTPSTPASGTKTARIGYVRHRGKLRVANPDPGQYHAPLVRVVSYDGIRDLAEATLRQIAIQINKTESELLTAVCDAVPSSAQPLARDFATGVETFPYALDELGGGAAALGVIKSIAVSSFAAVFMKGDGTLVLQSRTTRGAGTPAFHFDNLHHGQTANASVDELVNRVEVVVNPRKVDASATTVVYSTVGTALSVEAGKTVTLSVEYRDPDESRTLIGATDVVTTLVANTDYGGRPNENGSGSDVSSDIAIVCTAYASTATLAITNSGSATVYLVTSGGVPLLQIRGKGIYQRSPLTFSEVSTQPYGDKSVVIDARYMSNTDNAQGYATTVEERWNQPVAAMLEAIEFIASDSDDLLLQALARNPGDLIEVTETAIGASSLNMIIQSVQLSVEAGNFTRCTFGLAPAALTSYWQIGTAGRTELGETTTLGW